MKCPFCGSDEDKVIDSRAIKDLAEIRRRRECITCGRRFTTYERIEEVMPQVVKKNDVREPFDRSKIRRSIEIACRKRSISQEQIEQMVKEIERTVQELDRREISSQVIGEQVMKHLRKMDKVAYVRFASVYREFKDVDDFIDQVQELGKDARK
ncbi:MAG TPA: transcriptional regulator NrdR [bacterium]|nr:transcriptional regulator NrdR [bacterium]